MTRVFSDLHYDDRASSLRSLAALAPLFDGASRLVLNGDTLDTRPSSDAGATAAARGEVLDFFTRRAPITSWLTGNHDPDISDQHALELQNRRVYVTHGDILFENLVPWGRDADLLEKRVAEALALAPPDQRDQLGEQFRAFRRAAASIPQRHQSEKNPIKYALGFAADTFWPPLRILKVLRAWREAPGRAAALLHRHHLPARVFVMGHTHRRGVERTSDGILVLNTGSFCPPSSGGVVDITDVHVRLRAVERHRDEFRFGDTIAEFALARLSDAETLKP